MRRTFAVLFACVSVVACGRERRVEAPVVEVAVGPVDASAGQPRVTEAPPPDEEEGVDGSITGRWEGVGVQDDGQSWDLVVDLSTTKAGPCAVAEYPTVPCRAQWICTGARGGYLQAREKLLDDSHLRCVDNGVMTMRLAADGTLEWTWWGQGQTAHAKLRRR